MKKKIGISYTRTHFDNYWNWITKEDMQDDLELVKLSFEENNTEDINNGKPAYDNSPVNFQRERDVFEEKIYRYSQENKLPVLGICRGMQLVNVLEGGKLIQDLDNGNERHRKEELDKEHGIAAEEGTLLYKIANTVKGIVNSAHHQAIDPNSIGNNLVVNAYDDDETDGVNIIEGLEFKNKSDKAFMLCVQWHPERMKNKEANPFSENIKQQFLAAVRNK
jgi:putative glutamine amidotransferase